MSALLVPFLFELRRRKLKVGTTELLAVARACALGLHDDSLEGFYHVARALVDAGVKILFNYSEALIDVPPDVNPPKDLPRMRPGAVLSYAERQQALRIADQKANLVLREMFDTRQVCSTCHEVKHEVARYQFEIGKKVIDS